MYEILFTKKAEKFLDKLDNSSRERIIKTIERIRIRPEHFVEKLIGKEGYKLRVGDYRIFLDLNNKQLQILVITIRRRKKTHKK